LPEHLDLIARPACCESGVAERRTIRCASSASVGYRHDVDWLLLCGPVLDGGC
jgi:hypothetical protein